MFALPYPAGRPRPAVWNSRRQTCRSPCIMAADARAGRHRCANHDHKPDHFWGLSCHELREAMHIQLTVIVLVAAAGTADAFCPAAATPFQSRPALRSRWTCSLEKVSLPARKCDQKMPCSHVS